MLQLNHISAHIIIFFISNFPISFFNIYFFNIYTSPTFFPPLHFHLPTTLYINIILPLSLHLPFFCPFLFTPSYYKFITISYILCIDFLHKNRFSLSLSLSIFLMDFLFFLHLCFRLIIFYIL